MGAPAMNIMLRATKKITAEDPKSGSNNISDIAITTTRIGFQKPNHCSLNSSNLLEQYEEIYIIKANFISSDGCSENPKTLIHLLAPLTSCPM